MPQRIGDCGHEYLYSQSWYCCTVVDVLERGALTRQDSEESTRGGQDLRRAAPGRNSEKGVREARTRRRSDDEVVGTRKRSRRCRLVVRALTRGGRDSVDRRSAYEAAENSEQQHELG